MNIRPTFTSIVALAIGLASIASAQAAPRPAKPNIVLLLADDLGWQDVGCYDIDEPCPYETPNLDRLATEGVKFWQAYSPSPTCAPSRCAILSGKHPARAQKTHVVGGAPPSPFSKNNPMISPWYSGRMKMDEITIAEALKTNGYTTGCIGKWHCVIEHNAFPQPKDQGFDVSTMERGATSRPKPDRLSNFSTTAEDDPYRLDENGFPFHQNAEDALTFLLENDDKPFFLYHPTWLVHSPIHTRSEALLKKYCEKMDVPYPTEPNKWEIEGQKNPFYGAMVEALDYYVGNVIKYLDETEDPRWPGHKLAENTYVIFTSDNGGFVSHPGEFITTNAPLDKGKINAKEGGTRVPLIIRGPGIAAGKETDTMVNGLDFYPTIMNWTGTEKPAEQQLDGLDLAPFLKSDLSDNALIADASGKARDTMMWHFPNSVAMQSTIRRGNYKLIRNWLPYFKTNGGGLDLFELYDDSGKCVDVEEAKSVAAENPELTKELNDLLEEMLTEMKGSPPFLNPIAKSNPATKTKICTPLERGIDGEKVWMTYKENGAKVVKAHLLYTDNGGTRYEEWYRIDAVIEAGGKVTARLPRKTTHYVFNLIDENHYLVSYPEMVPENERKENYSTKALSAR